MGLTVQHVKTVTIADASDTNIVRPSDWNSSHIVQFSQDVVLGGNTVGVSTIAADKLYLQGGDNVTLSGVGSTVIVSAAAGGGAGFTAGVSTGGNTAGDTGTVSNRVIFAGGNNVTLSQGTAAGGATVTIIGPTQTAYQFANSNGVSFGTNGSTVTATVKTDYALSNHSHNLATTTTNGSQIVIATTNSDGATMAVPPFITTYAAQTNQTANFYVQGNTTQLSSTAGIDLRSVSFEGAGVASVGVSNGRVLVSVPAGGGGDGYNIIGVNGGATQLSTTLQLSNANNVSFGLNAGTITASASYAAQTNQTANYYATGNTTQLSSTAGNDLRSVTFEGAGAASIGLSNGRVLVSVPTQTVDTNKAGTGVTTAGGAGFSGTLNTNGLSVSIPSWLTTAALSNHSHNFATTTTNGSQIVVGTTNSAGATIGVPPFITTYVAQTADTNKAGTGFTTTTAAGAVIAGTNDTNGLKLGVPAFLTTARASNDAIGLNTAQTNVTWTVNSSGLSLNAGGYAGTGTTFGGTNVSATITLNTNGLALSLSGQGGGVTNQTGPNIAAGTQTATSGTVVFANSNNITFGMSGSTQVTASFNPVNIGMSTNGNTAGTTGTFDGAGLEYVFAGGNNITLSQSSNGSSVTLSIVGAAGGAAGTVDYFEPIRLGNNTSFSTFGQNSQYVQNFYVPYNLTLSNIHISARGSYVSSTNTGGHSQTIRYGLYQQGTGASTSQMTLLGSSSATLAATYNSVSLTYSLGNGVTSHTVTSSSTGLAARFSGANDWVLPFSTSLQSDMMYALGVLISTDTSNNVNVMRFAPLVMTVMNSTTNGVIAPGTHTIPSSTVIGPQEMGIYGTTTGSLVNSYATSQLGVAVSRQILYFNMAIT